MPREIKFRAWDKDEKKMLHDVGVHGNAILVGDDEDLLLSASEYPLMQFTGLHDRNGKEIYDGDVFELGDNFPSEVYWDTPTGSWKIRELGIVKSRGEEYQRTHEIMGYTILPTVIGNVHENPELLEMKEV